jgi:hypothetical protein
MLDRSLLAVLAALAFTPVDAAADLLGPTQPAPAGSTASLDLGDDQRLGVIATTGTGPDTAFLVVDFDATDGRSYAFAHAFDAADDLTAFDLVQAVADATDLDFAFSVFPDFGNAIFVDNFSLPSFGEAGDANRFWQFFTGTPSAGTIDWTSSFIGISDTPLADGLVAGFFNGFDPGVRPAVPVIPEPGVAALLVVAGVVAGGRRSVGRSASRR